MATVLKETSQQQADRLLAEHRESRGLPFQVCTGYGVGAAAVASRADFADPALAWAEYLATAAELRGADGHWVQLTDGVFPFQRIVASEVMGSAYGPKDQRSGMQRIFDRQIAAGERPLVIGEGMSAALSGMREHQRRGYEATR